MANEQAQTIRFHLLNDYAEVDGSTSLERPRIGQTLTVEVGLSESLRSAFLSAIANDATVRPTVRDALKTGQFRFALLPENMSVEEWNASTSRAAYPVPWELSGFGGTVVRIDAMNSGRSYMRPQELAELTRLGYTHGDPTSLLVQIDWGLGGGESFYDIVGWLMAHGVDIGISYLGERGLSALVEAVTRRVRNSRRDRRARKLAALWEGNNFFRPFDLRDFLEIKEAWTASEVSQRLRLGRKSTTQLLRSLGYLPTSEGLWRISRRWRASRRRQKWIRDEQDQIDYAEYASS